MASLASTIQASARSEMRNPLALHDGKKHGPQHVATAGQRTKVPKLGTFQSE